MNNVPEWKQNFTDHATNIALHITLSRDMVRAMELAYHYHYSSPEARQLSSMFGRSVPAMKALVRRGLVEHNPNGKPWYSFTPAGLLVWDLCVISGLVEVPSEQEKAA